MAWVAIAIGGSALVGAGASIFSGNQQAKAQKAAADKAAASQQQTNAQNRSMFDESRGSAGSAVMPLYMKNPDGSLFEGSLGQDLIKDYNGSNVGLQPFQDATDAYKPALAGATRTTNDIFNGGITKQLLDNTAPVRAARTSLARSSSLDALNKTLADINATQAGHGFGGDSYANRMMQFQGQRSAGDAMGAANIQNVSDIANTTNYGNVTLPMQNLNLPGQMAGQANQFAFMPQANWLNSINQRMQPLNMLKIGAGAPFQYTPLPVAGAGANMGMANMVTGAAGALSSGLGAYANQQNFQNLLAAYHTNAYMPPPQSAYDSAFPVGNPSTSAGAFMTPDF